MDRLSRRIVSGMLLMLLLTAVAALPFDIQPVRAESRNVIATCGSGYLEDVDGVLVLHVRGSPYEMGYQNGFLLKDRIQGAIQFLVQQHFVIDMGFSYEDLVNCAQAFEPHIPQEYIHEMQGVADGADMNYTDVLIANIGPDLEHCRAGSTGCSGFVVFGNASVDGHLYHGRSNDSPLPSPFPPEPTGLITVYEPENGNGFVSVGLVGTIGVHSGMTEGGISLGWTGCFTNDLTSDGMPSLLMFRKVLQYSDNLTEAISIICETDRTLGWTILLGDGENLNACVVETSANHCEVFWAGDPAEDMEPHLSIPNAVRRANHYVDADLAATQRSPYDPRGTWDGSWNRYEKLSQLIEENYGDIDADMSIEFLRTPPVAMPSNVESVVFDSTNLELWVAYGDFATPAYEREFIYLSVNDLLSQSLVDLSVSSTTGGSVTSPGEGDFTYEEGIWFDLVAEPDEGYRFANWTGDVDTIADVNAASTTITVSDDYSITANFEEVPPLPTGCFIATAAWGTPMADEIQILREFRDEYLLTKPVGRALVGVYYGVSPPIADFITEHPSLKPIVRAELMPIVAMCCIVFWIAPGA